MDFKLNIWNTDFRVIISKRMMELIKIKVKNLGGPSLLYNRTNITPAIYYYLLKGKSIYIGNYYEIISYLNLNLNNSEKEINGLAYNGGNEVYPFIKNFNPLLFRIVCHIIGDGTNSTSNTSRWIQKKSNSFWLRDLIKKEIGFFPFVAENYSDSCNFVTISAYFSKLIRFILDIDISLIKHPQTLKKILKFPYEYKLQFLAAFIVDEGCIRYKNVRSCIISQANKEFMEVISEILDDMGYYHSQIKEEIMKNGRFIYRLNIYVQGVLKFHKDLNNFVKDWGIFGGLWHKHKELELYVKTLSNNFSYSKLEIDLIDNIIKGILKGNDYISYDLLRKNPIIKQKLKEKGTTYLINKFYYLTKKGKFSRISKGVYKPLTLNL